LEGEIFHVGANETTKLMIDISMEKASAADMDFPQPLLGNLKQGID
jgi:hypothetical protein